MPLTLFTSTSQRSINDCGNCTTLLPTGITNVNGQVCRVLLDHTSDKSFVTEQFAKQSKAQIKNENNYYKGLSGEICKATKAALLHTSIGGKDICLTAALTPEIGQLRAVKSVPYQNWNYIKNRKSPAARQLPKTRVQCGCHVGSRRHTVHHQKQNQQGFHSSRIHKRRHDTAPRHNPQKG